MPLDIPSTITQARSQAELAIVGTLNDEPDDAGTPTGKAFANVPLDTWIRWYVLEFLSGNIGGGGGGGGGGMTLAQFEASTAIASILADTAALVADLALVQPDVALIAALATQIRNSAATIASQTSITSNLLSTGLPAARKIDATGTLSTAGDTVTIDTSSIGESFSWQFIVNVSGLTPGASVSTRIETQAISGGLWAPASVSGDQVFSGTAGNGIDQIFGSRAGSGVRILLVTDEPGVTIAVQATACSGSGAN